MKAASEIPSGRVSLVGAGPGDPRLLTVRAAQCLSQADLIIYDQLLPPALLDLAPGNARRLPVESLHPLHAKRGGLIIRAMIEAAQAGKHVVRLKGGDPFLFGRGGEECEALREAGIAYEVVPGISAAFGAGACCGIPLTHRQHASCVTLVTGHEFPEKGEPIVDWDALARLSGTLAVYMGLNRLETIVARLIQGGRAADTPAAAVQSATTNRQRTVTAPLGQLPQVVRQAGLGTPTLLLIGEVVALRERIAWYESRPLFGRRILICRPRGQAEEMANRLADLGAVPLVLPTVEVRPPEDWGPVDRAIDRLSEFQWLVFTSVNGVRFFLDRLFQSGRDLRALGGIRLAAIGPATARSLKDYHLNADVVPASYRSEDLATALLPVVAGRRILLARADRGREVLRDELSRIAAVEQVAVYSQVDAVDPGNPAWRQLEEGNVDWIALTSSNIARSLAGHLGEAGHSLITQGRTRVASISPVTSEAIRELGWPVAVEAREYTVPGLINALLRAERQGPNEPAG